MTGPLVMDIAGLELTEEDQRLINDPWIGGLILFSRNYKDPKQLKLLTDHIHSLRPDLLIAADQEGGRVQRFKDGFTRLPAMAKLDELYQQEQQKALDYAREIGWLMASELIASGVDLSFAPVLDLHYGKSRVIGDRSFSTDKATLIQLASHFIDGLDDAGMAACGKHFPGHGFVVADSHIAIARDTRTFEEIEQADLSVFGQLTPRLKSIMPAHVIYEKVDDQPAGFSKFWLQTQLRDSMSFKGILFSDDLGMSGAAIAGDICRRADAAIAAGMDMLLVCNQRDELLKVLDHIQANHSLTSLDLSSLKPRQPVDLDELKASQRWQHAVSISRELIEL